MVESTGAQLDDPDDSITIHQRKSIPLWETARGIVQRYPKRTVLGLALFIGQAFLYNAILFGYATLLSKFFGVATSNAPYYLVAFAVGNLLGPIVLGTLFDSVGRKPMIAGTYILSGVLLLITGYLFDQHLLTAGSLTLCLVGRVLLRLGRRQRRIPDRQRDLPDGDAGAGDRAVLRRRHGIGGIIGPAAVRPADTRPARPPTCSSR